MRRTAATAASIAIPSSILDGRLASCAAKAVQEASAS